jgi:hypothetical protein
MWMTVIPRLRPAVMVIAVAIVAAGCSSQHTSGSRLASAQRPNVMQPQHAEATAAGAKGDIPTPQCTPTTIGYVGVVRPGEALAARTALGSALLAEVTNSTSGPIDIARSANGISTAVQSGYFSQWQPVLSQSQQASLQSCDMLLSDRPAAQPLITAAMAAVAQDGYATSAAALKSELQEVLIADDPVAAGSDLRQ